MPKKTFFNLPEEKRALICEVGIVEFARYSYNAASINRIVANAGIAKGSFYQYFEDKRDLFMYLMELVSLEKANYIAPVITNTEQLDIYSLLRELYISGISFAEEHPEYAEIANRLLLDRDEAIYKELSASSMPAANEFFETLLENAVERGEVRADLDLRMFAYLIASMNAIVVEYCAANNARSIDREIMAGIDQFIEFLKNGMGVRETAGTTMEVTPVIDAIEGEQL